MDSSARNTPNDQPSHTRWCATTWSTVSSAVDHTATRHSGPVARSIGSPARALPAASAAVRSSAARTSSGEPLPSTGCRATTSASADRSRSRSSAPGTDAANDSTLTAVPGWTCSNSRRPACVGVSPDAGAGAARVRHRLTRSRPRAAGNSTRSSSGEIRLVRWPARRSGRRPRCRSRRPRPSAPAVARPARAVTALGARRRWTPAGRARPR